MCMCMFIILYECVDLKYGQNCALRTRIRVSVSWAVGKGTEIQSQIKSRRSFGFALQMRVCSVVLCVDIVIPGCIRLALASSSTASHQPAAHTRTQLYQTLSHTKIDTSLSVPHILRCVVYIPIHRSYYNAALLLPRYSNEPR